MVCHPASVSHQTIEGIETGACPVLVASNLSGGVGDCHLCYTLGQTQVLDSGSDSSHCSSQGQAPTLWTSEAPKQWVSPFLTLQPFNTIPCVMVTPRHSVNLVATS